MRIFFIGVLLLVMSCANPPYRIIEKIIEVVEVKCRPWRFGASCTMKDHEKTEYELIQHESDPIKFKANCWYKIKASVNEHRTIQYVNDILDEKC